MTLVVAGYPGTVDKIKFSRLLDFSMYSGVDGLELAPSGSNRGISVSFDHAAVPGVIVEQTAPMVVSAVANDSSFNRRDRIILRHDWGNNQTTLAIKAGTPAASPSWPSTVRNPGVLWEQSIGRITVGPGMGAIPSGNIIASGIPRQSPVIILDDETGLPFASERIVVIDPETGRVRASDGSSYHEILPGNIEWTTISQPSQWSGSIRYARRAGQVTVRGATDRNALHSGPAELRIGTLPSAARPAFDVHMVGYQRRDNTTHFFGMVIETSGDIRVIVRPNDPPLVAAGVWLRFCVSYPVF